MPAIIKVDTYVGKSRVTAYHDLVCHASPTIPNSLVSLRTLCRLGREDSATFINLVAGSLVATPLEIRKTVAFIHRSISLCILSCIFSPNAPSILSTITSLLCSHSTQTDPPTHITIITCIKTSLFKKHNLIRAPNPHQIVEYQSTMSSTPHTPSTAASTPTKGHLPGTPSPTITPLHDPAHRAKVMPQAKPLGSANREWVGLIDRV